MHRESEIMSLSKEAVSFAPNINLAACCSAWLQQYKDSYRIMNRICSSNKGNRYSFQLTTEAHLEQDDEGKEFYRISLATKRTCGDIFLEGPSIAIDSEYTELVCYMLLSLEKHFLETNSISIVEYPFNGYLSKNKPAPMKSYRPASVIFDVKDAMNDDYLRSMLQQEAICYSENVSDELLIRLLYDKALEKCDTVDSRTLETLEDSNTYYSKVLRFDSNKKKR